MRGQLPIVVALLIAPTCGSEPAAVGEAGEHVEIEPGAPPPSELVLGSESESQSQSEEVGAPRAPTPPSDLTACGEITPRAVRADGVTHSSWDGLVETLQPFDPTEREAAVAVIEPDGAPESHVAVRLGDGKYRTHTGLVESDGHAVKEKLTTLGDVHHLAMQVELIEREPFCDGADETDCTTASGTVGIGFFDAALDAQTGEVLWSAHCDILEGDGDFMDEKRHPVVGVRGDVHEYRGCDAGAKTQRFTLDHLRSCPAPKPGEGGAETAPEVVERDEAAAKASVAKGRRLTRSKDYPAAIAAFDAAIRHDDGLRSAWAGRGYAKLLASDLDGARADLEEGLRRGQGEGQEKFRAAVYFNLGLVAEARGDSAAAASAFEQSNRERPGEMVRKKLAQHAD